MKPHDPFWERFTSLPIIETRSPERIARYEEAMREIREGRYERPEARERYLAWIADKLDPDENVFAASGEEP